VNCGAIVLKLASVRQRFPVLFLYCAVVSHFSEMPFVFL